MCATVSSGPLLFLPGSALDPFAQFICQYIRIDHTFAAAASSSEDGAIEYAETRPYAEPEKAARKLLEIANSVELLTLDDPLIAKPSTRIESLGDPIRLLATLAPEVHTQPHSYRTIHSVGAAVDEPRSIHMTTLNLQAALAMDHLLLTDPVFSQANHP